MTHGLDSRVGVTLVVEGDQIVRESLAGVIVGQPLASSHVPVFGAVVNHDAFFGMRPTLKQVSLCFHQKENDAVGSGSDPMKS